MTLALFGHAVWLTIFVYFLWVGRSSPEPGGFVGIVRAIQDGFREDAIQTAAELGRLDVVSLSLTVLGVTLALAALSSFFMMRHAVIETTREEAKASFPRIMKDSEMISALTEMMKSDPVFMTKLRSALRYDTIPDEAADGISRVIADES